MSGSRPAGLPIPPGAEIAPLCLIPSVHGRRHGRDLDHLIPPPRGLAGFLRCALTYLRPHWAGAVLVLLTLIPAVAFYGIQPTIYRLIVDEAVLTGDGHRLLILLAFLAVTLALRFAGELGREYTAARLGALVVNGLRVRLFDHLERLSLDFYARARIGDLMTRYTANLASIENVLTQELPLAITRGLILLLCVSLLFQIEARMTALILVLMGVLSISPVVLTPRADLASSRRQEQLAQLAATVQETIVGHLVVKAFGLHELTLQRLLQELARLRRSTVRFGLLSGLLSATMSVGGACLNALAIGLGAFLVIRGELSLGTLIAFIDLMWYVAEALEGLARNVRPLQEAAAANERIQELLGEEPRVVDAAAAQTLPAFEREIRLDDVTFSYSGQGPSLSHVDLVVPRGSSVALVGPSGCGKSTMLSLLLRFHDADHGVVAIDGHDVREVTQRSLRAQMGAVFQESILFNLSIRENIRLGRPNASDEEVQAAAQAAEVDAFVGTLPGGYDTVVGERGSRLSGGERQRVAIARAILRDPSILVLDEATSALDPATEGAINATLERLGHGRTVVAVTHRLATAVKADRICVLDGGRVVEQGRHEELLTRHGPYRALWDKQANVRLSPDGSRGTIGVEGLRRLPIFKDLDEDLLAEVSGRFATEWFVEGRPLIHQGDPGDKFYVIVHGKAEVLKPDEHGQERRVAVLHDGDYFGEVALLRNLPRTATVRTLTPTVLLSLHRTHFLDLVSRTPPVRAMLERVMVERGYDRPVEELVI